MHRRTWRVATLAAALGGCFAFAGGARWLVATDRDRVDEDASGPAAPRDLAGATSDEGSAPGLVGGGAPDAPDRRDAAPDAEAEGRVALGGPWIVRIVDGRDGRPIPDAEVEVEVVIVADPRAGPSRTFSATRRGRADAKGVATLTRMPVARASVLAATAPGYRRGELRLPPADAGVRHLELALVARLAPELASARIDVDVDGRPLASSDATLLVTLPGGAMREVRVGEGFGIDDDPAGPETREAEVRVVVPGYVGPTQRVVVTRGRRTRIDATLPPPTELTVVALDAAGAGVPGVEVAVAPAASSGAIEAAATWRGATDARGEVVVTARLGHAVAVRLRADAFHFPLSDRIVDVRGPRQRVEALGVPLAPVTLTLAGRVSPPATLALAWDGVAFHRGVLDRAALQPPTAPAPEAGAALERTLPRRLDVPADGRRPVRVSMRLLPGAYTVVASADGVTSAPTSFAVPPEGAEVELRLENLVPVSFRLVGDEPASPSPFAGAVWFGHRASFGERYRVHAALARLFAAPPGSTRTALVTSIVEAARGRREGFAADLAVVGDDGRVAGLSDGLASEGTLLLPDGRVAVVAPAPRPGTTSAPVYVPARAFAALVVRTLDAEGRPQAGVRVLVNPLAPLLAGRQELLRAPATDARGELVVGVVAGDEIGVVPLRGRWAPTAAQGATAALRRTEVGEAIVAVRMGEGPVATIELRPDDR